ncbi:vWA domain-containing protein [Planococcus beigongshangi]|uniref:vWA domain-containing protein n=1 Tax=Planococcus beigongshangi TaxID=2782536 RepID=UPI001EEF4E30|nr:VWA domain-containing protein [Planococcus beigongshangi]
MGLFDKIFKKPEKEEAKISGISLKKKEATIVLEKKKLTGVRARVGIVLDISGSMRKLYNDGVVQEVVERVLAVASQFDDDGELDVWVYDNEFSRLPGATEATFMGYVEKNILSNSGVHKFGRNDEPKVMEDVIRKYTKQDPSGEPVFLVFINDGGCKSGIKKFIVESSDQPIFWQFVGIGDSNFDVLRKLDTMGGRVVDNANFFHVDDISKISDAELYDQLLNEFPMWLKEAKEKGILR